MINNVTLVGRLVKDLELRYTPAGKAVASGTIAVNRTFTNGQGEREADFINIVIWNKTAENAANFLKKGSLAGIIGRINTRNYENNEGKRVYVTEVIAEQVQFLDTKENGNSGNNQSSYGNNNGNSSNKGNTSNYNSNSNSTRSNDFNDPFANDGTPINISDDDLPF